MDVHACAIHTGAKCGRVGGGAGLRVRARAACVCACSHRMVRTRRRAVTPGKVKASETTLTCGQEEGGAGGGAACVGERKPSR